MPWTGELELRYRLEASRTVCRDRHCGPLRVLQSLYPEGPEVCQQVLVHPPGGLVGGDTLAIDIDAATGSHALITTPSAARFYRSDGPIARQSVRARLEPGSVLEWLPLETLVYSGARSESHQRFDLQGDAKLIAWDVLALGLPASDRPFERGQHCQHLELPGVWLERGVIDALDRRLLDSPIGWAGRSVLATLFAASGEAQGGSRLDRLLDDARAVIDQHRATATAGVTRLNGDRGVVLRALAARVEPAMNLLAAVWAAWRPTWVGRPATPPRVWRL